MAGVYLYDDVNNIPDGILNETFSLMPPERQKRALRYRYEIDRNLCILSYWLLLYGLKRDFGISKPPSFNYGENGKPYLVNYNDVFFNISHCKEGVVCAVSDTEVGVDIQNVMPFDMAVAKRVCTNNELEQLAVCQNPERLFCRIWTIKESFIKQYGCSIADPLNTIYAQSIYEQLRNNAASFWAAHYHVCCFGAGQGAVQKINFENCISKTTNKKSHKGEVI